MRDKPITDRLADLERMLSFLSPSPHGTAGTIGKTWQVRIGKTQAKNAETYPEFGNVLPFVFVDAEFEETSGYQPLTAYERTADAQTVGYSFQDWIPEYTIVVVFYLRKRWWILDLGEQQPASSSSGSDSIGSESIGSESSGSESSGSQGSEGSISSDSGSDKSTAIVSAKWSPSGYTALAVVESPEVRFIDQFIVEVHGEEFTAAIDPRFVAVCERDSIEVSGWSANIPLSATPGFVVSNNQVTIRRKEVDPMRLVISLSGVRKGFANWRFPDRRRDQFEDNERFINSAYRK